jgi:hypothetical protein
MCMRGILTEGEMCSAAQDACGNGLRCCGTTCTQSVLGAPGIWVCP